LVRDSGSDLSIVLCGASVVQVAPASGIVLNDPQ
jgi:hypothetical protein